MTLAIGLDEVHGLPAHVLLVHLAVLAVPAAALALVAAAAWPAARRRLGLATPLAALGALVCVPVTVHAGRWLAARVGQTPLLQRHEQLGAQLLPWVAALFAVSVLNHLWLRDGRADVPPDPPSPAPSGSGGTATLQRPAAVRTPSRRWAPAVATALAVVVGVGSVVQVYRIGDSGARAAWQGNFSAQPR